MNTHEFGRLLLSGPDKPMVLIVSGAERTSVSSDLGEDVTVTVTPDGSYMEVVSWTGDPVGYVEDLIGPHIEVEGEPFDG